MRLRTIIFTVFLLVAWLPVAGTIWLVSERVYEKEFAAVEEKHLLLAQHVSLTLARYITDIELTFSAIADSVSSATAPERFAPLPDLLIGMNFRHFCFVDPSGRITLQRCQGRCQETEALPAPLLAALTPYVERAERGGDVIFTDVIANPKGVSAVYLIAKDPSGGFALGELGLEYVQEVQRAIAFGEQGHAAIVDAKGQLLAHPLQSWADERRDISHVSVVRSMIDGETGVGQFYSPAKNADMVAGFTTIPGVGWGVMVPQPLAELTSLVSATTQTAKLIAVSALFASIIAGSLLSGIIERFLTPIARAARNNAHGDFGARAFDLPKWGPSELRGLGNDFNVMAATIEEALRRKQEALKEARKERDGNEAKTEFLAQVSHEFRTPLNAILGFSEVIRDEHFGPLKNDRYLDYAGSIHNSGVHLLGLIDDVMEVSKTDLKRRAPEEEWFDVRKVIAEARELVAESHRGEDRTRELYVEASLPQLRGDRRMLKQILINLISNAEKYTPEQGTIRIRATLLSAGGVEIAISDTGIGIAADEVSNALAPFGRVKAGLAMRRNGTGLGLTLAKSLTELHGGEMRIDSVKGSGTTIRVRWPRDRVEPLPPRPRGKRRPQKDRAASA